MGGIRPDDSRSAGVGESYAVLVFDASRDDRQIRESLTGLGLGGFISESSLEVPMDDFGSFKMIPLDSFHDEIEAFDPRDDGYAAKLRAFFVREGKRFFFLPLDRAGNGVGKLKKALSLLPEDLPFNLVILGREENFFCYFLLLAAACACSLFLRGAGGLFILELPVLLAFGWRGPSAFVLAAILAGIWELLREPLRELAVSGSYKRRAFDYAGSGLKGVGERLKPFRLNLALALLFLIFLPIFSVAAELPLIPVFTGTLFFFLIYFLSFRAEVRRALKNRHTPFTPVLLFPFKVKTFSLFPFLLPFCAGAVLALFLPLFLPGASPSPDHDSAADTEFIVSLDDYNQHLAFQRSFSFRSLNQEPSSEEYLRYNLADDGLILNGAVNSNSGEAGPNGSSDEEGPPFPLDKLVEFLIQYNKPAGGFSRGIQEPFAGLQIASKIAALGSALFRLKVWITVVIILTACITNLLRPGTGHKKKKKIPAFGDKRIAA